MYSFILCCLTCAVVSATLWTGATAAWPPVWHSNTFHRLDNFLPTNMTAYAIVDWDGDFNTDLIMTNGSALYAMIWKGDGFQQHDLKYTFRDSGFVNIDDIFALDFNRDALPDLMVRFSTGTEFLTSRILLQESSTRTVSPGPDFTNSTMPLTSFSVNGRCALPDLIGVWNNTYGVIENLTPQSDSCSYSGPGCTVSYSPNPSTTFTARVTPPSTIQVAQVSEVTNDMSADLIFSGIDGMSTTTMQYTILVAPSYFTARSFRLPIMSGIPAFEDIDNDGVTDVVVPVCYPYDNNELCGSSSSLPSQTNYTHLLFVRGDGKDGSFRDVIPGITDCTAADFCTLLPLTFDGTYYPLQWSAQVPPTIKLADYDLDRYPDVLVTSGNTIIVLRNAGSQIGSTAFRTNWQLSFSGTTTWQGVRAAWMDVGEDGKMDVVACGAVGNARQCTVYVNDIALDGLFVSGHILNGAQHGTGYGTTQVGAVQKFSYLDVSQNTQQHTGTQLSSLQYGSMPYPHGYFGLGRTYSYLTTYTVGINVQGELMSRSWEALIPNSFVIVSPYPIEDPDEWILELFVSPKWLLYVALGVIVMLVALAVPIAYLKYKEHKEDKEERRRTLEYTGMVF